MCICIFTIGGPSAYLSPGPPTCGPTAYSALLRARPHHVPGPTTYSAPVCTRPHHVPGPTTYLAPMRNGGPTTYKWRNFLTKLLIFHIK